MRSFFLRAARRATPSCVAAPRLGVPSRQPIDNHFKSACIQNVRRWHIHVSHHQLGAHTSTSFPANACNDVCECMSSSTKHSRLRTSCSMVATCHILMHGNHFFKMICSKQTPFALSYGENEWYPLTHVACAVIGLKNLSRDLGRNLESHLMGDTPATNGIGARRGVGKIRHFETRPLWLLKHITENEILQRKKDQRIRATFERNSSIRRQRGHTSLYWALNIAMDDPS